MNFESEKQNQFLNPEALNNALILIGGGSISEDRFRSFLTEDSKIVAADGEIFSPRDVVPGSYGVIPVFVFQQGAQTPWQG